MLSTKRFILYLFLICFATQAFAQASFRLQAPRQVVEGNRFTLSFELRNGEAGAPKAPELENCRLLYGPSTSTMTSMQWVNGQQSSSTSVTYTFTYRAEKAGKINVPEVSVTCDGKRLTTHPATITVLPPDKTSPSQGGSGVDAYDLSTQTPDKKISADDLFVRVSLNKTSVYEQEAIIATVKVYTKYNISSFRATQQPTFEGFLSEELEVPNQVEQEHFNGQNYTTAVLKRCIIYPQKTGRLTINSGTYEVTVVQYELVSNGFFQTRRPVEQQLLTRSNTATVNVQPLPEPRPASFNGAVGSFTASAALSPTELRTNEPASYVLTVSGTGNIKQLKSPELDLPQSIDCYTPKTDIDARFNGSNMTGTYKVTYTLVPQQPGNFEIPASEFSYFDLSTKTYKTIPVEGFNIKVAQGASTSATTEQTAIAKGMTDILHIHPSDADAQTREHVFTFRTGWYLFLYVLAVLSFLTVIFAYRRQLKLNADIVSRRRAGANKEATKRLREAKKMMDKNDWDGFHEALNGAIWGYLSNKLGIPVSGLVRENISGQLQAYGASPETIAEIINILDECEMARFTPRHDDNEMPGLYNKAADAIHQIENIKK